MNEVFASRIKPAMQVCLYFSNQDLNGEITLHHSIQHFNNQDKWCNLKQFYKKDFYKILKKKII